MILLGTSGYSYADWVGPFYPPGTRPARMLELYCQRFSAVEINATYYRLPGIKTFESLVRRSPERFRFTVKLPGEITHQGGLDRAGSFLEVIRPLIDAGKFGCALAQFPYAFKNQESSRAFVSRLAQRLGAVRVVVEFRHRSWQLDPVYPFLRSIGLGLACVDEPDLPGLPRALARATSRLGYVRFHGRNSQQWFDHETSAQRYDYLYSEDELAGWLPRIRELEGATEELYVFFNNHFAGQAPANGEQLAKLLSAAP